jgi:putative transposase
VRTVRAECLDWVLIRNDRHLDRILTAYLAHYNTARTHRGINLDVPVPSDQIDADGDIERLDILGGLIHEYRRAA